MMKQISLILIFLLLTNTAIAQSKKSNATRKQTEAWILEKINLYAAKESYFSNDIINDNISTKEYNFSFSFKDDNLIISSRVNEIISNRNFYDKLRSEEKNYSRIVTIPLNKLNNKYFVKDTHLVFSADYNAFISKGSDAPSYELKSSWYGIPIDIYGEERFVEKFNKAMFHLLTFVKKSDSKDLF